MFSVELIGIPGAGKSTLSNALLKELRKNNKQQFMDAEDAFVCVARRRFNKVYRTILNCLPCDLEVKFIRKIVSHSHMQVESQNEFLARHGEALKAFLASPEFQEMTYDDRKIVIGSFLSVGSLYQAISVCIDNSTAVFFDEGLIQKSMMFVAHTDHPRGYDNVFEYLSHIPLPDLVVYLKANPASCKERMKTRSKGLTKRLAKADGDAVTRFLIKADAHMEDVVALLIKEGKTTLLEVNNNVSVGETLKILMSLLPHYLRN